ncbi:hypothetical protein [Umezawaea tangerina]|uniref:Uncharacterized protein n=1 Tax=Umezawaea tangerina TaxID=84725 RepID=A0A2T0SLH5_9PSEU|nr:hypothetical protein [Umezawaea tangerina]PRY34267.1 hypothetical protein CLV43_11740 [Umezawaea tangerina]
MSGQHEGTTPEERRRRRKAAIVRWSAAGRWVLRVALLVHKVVEIVVDSFPDS